MINPVLHTLLCHLCSRLSL